jgi:EAL domain-containing protein (putative c-di-GMP-specific phosphodiesterase class I)
VQCLPDVSARQFHDSDFVDQSFVCNILSDRNDADIAKIVMVPASNMGMQVIAEGVETIEQRDLPAAIDSGV